MIPFGYLGMQPLKERLLQGAEELGLEIMSFHEIETKAVTRPIATICIVGKCPRERLVYSSGMRPGDSILLTGFAGTEGAMRLAQEHGGKGLLADAERDYILEQGSRLSILRESLLVANHARAMLEVGEGGVLSALYRLCEASQCGAYLEEKDIPVLESTRALCRERVLDPLRLASLGSIVIATDHEEQVLDLMKGAGITCTCIGKAVSRAQGVRILCLDGMTRPCGKPRADELMKVYA